MNVKPANTISSAMIRLKELLELLLLWFTEAHGIHLCSFRMQGSSLQMGWWGGEGGVCLAAFSCDSFQIQMDFFLTFVSALMRMSSCLFFPRGESARSSHPIAHVYVFPADLPASTHTERDADKDNRAFVCVFVCLCVCGSLGPPWGCRRCHGEAGFSAPLWACFSAFAREFDSIWSGFVRSSLDGAKFQHLSYPTTFMDPCQRVVNMGTIRLVWTLALSLAAKLELSLGRRKCLLNRLLPSAVSSPARLLCFL